MCRMIGSSGDEKKHKATGATKNRTNSKSNDKLVTQS